MLQSPQKLSYQCVIRNAGGGLVINHSAGIKISILQGTPLGTMVYQETFNPVPQTNANGLVSIEIGGGVSVSGTFSTINWASGPYFLKTEADPAGGTNYTISGTSQLLSVPYAIYAKTAENGFSGNYYDLTNKPILFSGNYNDLTNKPVLFDGSWVNLSGKPTTISGYGITDAVTITGNQTITGIKTFSNDLSVNELTIGKGKNAVSAIQPLVIVFFFPTQQDMIIQPLVIVLFIPTRKDIGILPMVTGHFFPIQQDLEIQLMVIMHFIPT